MSWFTRKLACLVLPAAIAPASCTSADAAGVSVVVEVPRSMGVDDAAIRKGFADSLPRYRGVRGLERKYFILSATSLGGVYLWRDAASAEAFFDVAWHERVRKTYGADARLTWFDVPVTTVGGSPGSAGPDSVVAVVRVKKPAIAPDALVGSRMKDSVPTYAAVPGLVYKYFSLTRDGRLGGIYLWQDRAAADAFYESAWRARVRDSYGEDGQLDMFEAPLVLSNMETAR